MTHLSGEDQHDAPAEPAFDLHGVSLRYPTVAALDGVSLRIERGEQVALIGPSGAGKTSLLKMLNGSLLPTEGSVVVAGEKLVGLTGREQRLLRARIGFIPQHLGLVPNLRVLQNVLTGRMGSHSFWQSARMMVFPRRTDVAEAYRLLDRVGIGEKLYQRTDRLSGGQQQRVAIARCLYQQPRAILADEPVAHVDPARAEQTIRLLQEIAAEQQLALCVSLHNVELAKQCFPRVIGLRAGRICWDTSTSSVSDRQWQELFELGESSPQADVQ